MRLGIDKKNWSKTRLDEVVEWYQRDIPNRLQETEGIATYVTANHIDTDAIAIGRYGDLSDGQKGPTITKHFESGDVLLSTRSVALRKAAQTKMGGVTGEKLLVLRPIENSALSKALFPFVFHCDSFWNYALNTAAGSVNKFTSWNKLRNYEFLLPPKDQQAKLAELLWAADAPIERASKLHDSAAKLQQSIYAASAKNSERTRIRSVAAVSNGTTPSTKQPRYWNGGTIPWLPTGSVHDKFITGSKDLITEAAISEKKAKIKPAKSTLVAMIGQGKTRGSAAMLRIDAAINQNFACVTPHSVDPTYLFYSLFFSYHRLRGSAQGTNQEALNCELVGNFRIPLPDEHQQSMIASQLEQAETTINQCRDTILASRSLLKSLINQIF